MPASTCGSTFLMKYYDILFAADHFVLVTTVEIITPAEEEEIEHQALERMASEYGADFANTLKKYSRLSITEAPLTKDMKNGAKS